MSPSSPTYGEELLTSLLKQLSAERYHCYSEPRIDSSRNSRYPDFVIIDRKRGVLVIEVKDYVGTVIDGDNEHIRLRKRDGTEKTERNPVSISRDYRNCVSEVLEKRRELLGRKDDRERLRFPVDDIVIMIHFTRDHIRQLVERGIFPPGKVLGNEDIQSADRFRHVLERYQWTFTTNREMSDLEVSAVAHALRATEVRACPAQDTLGEKRGSLTREQEDQVFAPLPYAEAGYRVQLLWGCVGSGKTLVIAAKADLLADLRPDLHILVTTFQIDPCKDLRKRIRNPRVQVRLYYEICQEILGQNWPSHHMYRGQPGPSTIGSWVDHNMELLRGYKLTGAFVAMEIARRKDLQASEERYKRDIRERDPDITEAQIEGLCLMYDLYREYQETLKKANEPWQDYEDVTDMARFALHRHKWRQYFDVILVDEAQDFAPQWIRLLRAMLAPGGLLYMAEDPLQSLWRSYNLSHLNINPQSVEHNHLSCPMRTTREIMELAEVLLEEVPEMRPVDDDSLYPTDKKGLPSGPRPIIARFGERSSEVCYVEREVLGLLQQGVAPSEIGVIFPHKDGLYDSKPTSTDDACLKARLEKELEARGVYVAHFNRVKGLEFSHVFIPFWDEMFSRQNSETVILRRLEFRRLFVAMTRSRHSLTLTHCGDLPACLQPMMFYADSLAND